MNTDGLYKATYLQDVNTDHTYAITACLTTII